MKNLSTICFQPLMREKLDDIQWFPCFETCNIKIFRVTQLHMFNNRTNHLAMVIVRGWRS